MDRSLQLGRKTRVVCQRQWTLRWLITWSCPYSAPPWPPSCAALSTQRSQSTVTLKLQEAAAWKELPSVLHPLGLPASRGLQLQGSGPPSAGGTSAQACSPGPGRCGGRSGGSAAGRGGGWMAGVGGRARGGSSRLGEVGGCEGSEEEQNRQPVIDRRNTCLKEQM